MIDVWRVDLDTAVTPPPTPGEAARAARLATGELARRYLAAHGALRAILGKFAAGPLSFALRETGKPYLPLTPAVRFNLSRSRGRALIAVARDIEVGVDIEHIRPMLNYAAVAERYLPPGDEEPADELDFFRRWTRYEAQLKARGVGLYGAGALIEGEWTVQEVDPGDGFAGAVAGEGLGLTVNLHDFGEDK